MLDILILVAFGALFGWFCTFKQLRSIYIVLIVGALGGLLGFLVSQVIPLSYQSFGDLLRFTQPNSGLSFVWSQSHNIQDVAAVAEYVDYYVILVGVVSSLFGYALVFLASKLRSGKRHRRE